MTLRVHPLIMKLAQVLILFSALAACKKTPVAPVNRTPDGLAIKGYDPVAYFAEGRPVPGLAENEFTWKGAKWRFASAEHRAMFRLYPDKYAPQYDGYCAYAVSQG